MAVRKPKARILITENEDPTIEDLKRAYQRRLYSEHAVTDIPASVFKPHQPPSVAGLMAAVRHTRRRIPARRSRN